MSNPNEPMPLNYFMPGPMVEEGFQARAGEPLQEDTAIATMEEVEKALRTVYDPEIPVDIYELGLIYECDINQTDGSTAISMTLTAPGCPVAGILPGQVAEAVAGSPASSFLVDIDALRHFVFSRTPPNFNEQPLATHLWCL